MTTTLIGEKREGSARITKGEGFELRFAETWNYLVVASTTSESREEVILGTTGLPIVGISIKSSGAVCTSLSAERRSDNALLWDVTAEYESQPLEQEQDDSNSPDPKTWKPKLRLNFSVKEKLLTMDKSTVPKEYVNSAGQPFETQLTEKKLISAIPFVQFEDPDLTIDEIIERNNTCNDATYLTKDEYTLLLTVTSAEKGFFGTYAAWRIGYELRYDPDTWEDRVFNVGSEYLDGGVLKPYEDANGHRIYGFLDFAGAKAPTGTRYIRSFRPYEAIDFSDFLRLE